MKLNVRLLKSKKVKNGALSFLLPAGLAVILIVLWQTKTLHALFGLTEVQLPVLGRILELIRVSYKEIAVAARATIRVAVGGLAVGSLIGFLVAVFATAFPKGGIGALGVLSAVNAVPMVALAPIMSLWFSTSAMTAKSAVVAICCMVPMSVNAFRGLNDLAPNSLDLMKSYAAKSTTVFFKLRLPNCVPHIFTALRINVSTAMIAALISEYFSADGKGMGRVIKNSLGGGSQIVKGWAYIFIASLIGIVLFMLVLLLESRIVKKRA